MYKAKVEVMQTKKRAIKKYWKTHISALRFIDDVLQVNWPKVFPKKPEPKVPLAIGFTSELLAKKDQLNTTDKIINKAIFLWCRGWRYHKACIVPGAARYNLEGEVCGYISDRDAKYARSKLLYLDEEKQILNEFYGKME